jgi:hypothetical protein
LLASITSSCAFAEAIKLTESLWRTKGLNLAPEESAYAGVDQPAFKELSRSQEIDQQSRWLASMAKKDTDAYQRFNAFYLTEQAFQGAKAAREAQARAAAAAAKGAPVTQVAVPPPATHRGNKRRKRGCEE